MKQIINNKINKKIYDKNGILFYYHTTAQLQRIKHIKTLLNKTTHTCTSLHECYVMYHLLKQLQNTKGHLCEVGVYNGGTALIQAELKKDNEELHLFDTFTGLPFITQEDKGNPNLYTGAFKGSYAKTKWVLKPYKNIHIHKGIFEEQSNHAEGRKYKFVHIDVDLYSTVKYCLQFFKNKLTHNAILFMSDYGHNLGVTKAMEEFTKEYLIIPISAQNSIMIKK